MNPTPKPQPRDPKGREIASIGACDGLYVDAPVAVA